VAWSFGLMMGLGLFGVAVSLVGLYRTRNKWRLPRSPWSYSAAILALPAALAANIFGWLLTEMGPQPWPVHGELLTAASVSPGVDLGTVAKGLAFFTAVYGGLFVVEVGLLWKYIKAGPSQIVPDLEDDEDESQIPHFSY